MGLGQTCIGTLLGQCEELIIIWCPCPHSHFHGQNVHVTWNVGNIFPKTKFLVSCGSCGQVKIAHAS